MSAAAAERVVYNGRDEGTGEGERVKRENGVARGVVTGHRIEQDAIARPRRRPGGVVAAASFAA